MTHALAWLDWRKEGRIEGWLAKLMLRPVRVWIVYFGAGRRKLNECVNMKCGHLTTQTTSHVMWNIEYGCMNTFENKASIKSNILCQKEQLRQRIVKLSRQLQVSSLKFFKASKYSPATLHFLLGSNQVSKNMDHKFFFLLWRKESFDRKLIYESLSYHGRKNVTFRYLLSTLPFILLKREKVKSKVQDMGRGEEVSNACKLFCRKLKWLLCHFFVKVFFVFACSYVTNMSAAFFSGEIK